MTKDQQKALTFIGVAIIFLIITFSLRIRADKIENDYQFSGIVQNITYGDKHIPKVIIKGESYFLLSSKEDFNNQIKMGDSLIKKKNTIIYKLVKQYTGEVFISK